MTSTETVFLETADRIGARLCRDTLWADRRCTWLTTYPDHHGSFVHRALVPTLYDGACGTALFLSRLFAVTEEKVFRLTAEAALRQVLSRRDDVVAGARLGFYSGLPGIIYVLAVLGEITGHEAFTEDALTLARELPADSADPNPLDVIGGSAGAIPSLLHLYRRHRKEFLLDLAIGHGKLLLEAANKTDAGRSWTTLKGDGGEQRPDLTGFAHGAAGIAWALLELFHETRDEKLRLAAEEGFRYERSCFSPEEENWPDFRTPRADLAPDEKPRCSTRWCHGAVGIGFSRLRAWQVLGNDVYRDEAEVAIRTTVKSLGNTREGSYCLCHGHAGNAELLLYASQILENPEYESIAQRVGSEGIEWYEKEKIPWPCESQQGHETPDLMLGMAGIGYFYLRLHHAATNPPVLIIVPEEDSVVEGREPPT